jgi:hypothetical protein
LIEAECRTPASPRWAIGEEPAKVLIGFSPAGNMEEFFRDA